MFALVFVIVLPLMATPPDTGDKPVDTTLRGKLVCLGCDLKKAEGARASCKTYGHNHVLKTGDGLYINFLENQYADDFVKGEKYQGKNLVVHGRYYPVALLIDVESFEVDGKKKSWCDHCKAMDGCAAMKK